MLLIHCVIFRTLRSFLFVESIALKTSKSPYAFLLARPKTDENVEGLSLLADLVIVVTQGL